MELLETFAGTFGTSNTPMWAYALFIIVSCGFMYVAYQVLKRGS